MAEGKKRMRSAMDALDDVKDKMPEDAYLMLCNASKEKYARLRGGVDAHEEEGTSRALEEEDRGGGQMLPCRRG